jgi:hypothetical protein
MFASMAYVREVRGVKTETIATYDCEGNACSVVALTWDQERQQFRVQNDSNQQVKIEVFTFAGTSSVSVAPHKAEYLEVKTFNGPYHANYE